MASGFDGGLGGMEGQGAGDDPDQPESLEARPEVPLPVEGLRPGPTFADLPEDQTVWFCPEVSADLKAAYSVAAELDRGLSVWCGICRFDSPHRGSLGAVLAAWPMLAQQEVPRMGQFYEHTGRGLWLLREGL